MSDQIYTPPEGPPQGPGPSKDIFALMGSDNIYQMSEDFYRKLEHSEIRSMFPEDMVAASRKQAAFLIGLMGGPPVYIEAYGPPRMRARHLPFAIDEQARQVWLGSFKSILENAESRYQFPSAHLPGFISWLDTFSAWMVNRKS